MSRGFTLVELMLSVSIICLLLAIMIPSYGRSRAEAELSSCVRNLHGIGVAFQMYMNDNPQPGQQIVAWSRLVPRYMARIPTCPSTGASAPTASAGYWVWSTTQNGVSYNFITCMGSHNSLIRNRSSQYQGPTYSPRTGVSDGRNGQWTF